MSGTPFGFVWFALDQRIGYPSTFIDANYVSNGNLNAFTVLIIPSVAAAVAF